MSKVRWDCPETGPQTIGRPVRRPPEGLLSPAGDYWALPAATCAPELIEAAVEGRIRYSRPDGEEVQRMELVGRRRPEPFGSPGEDKGNKSWQGLGMEDIGVAAQHIPERKVLTDLQARQLQSP